MAAPLQYVGMSRILNKLDRDFKNHNLGESDVIEWAGEALEKIGCVQNMEEAVAFLEVKNHKALIPRGANYLIQIARNNSWCPEWTASNCQDDNILCPAQIALQTTVEEDVASNCAPVCLDCDGSPIGDVAYYRPYFDLKFEYYGWRNSQYYIDHYSPVQLAQHTFFSSLVCKETHQVTGNQSYSNTGSSSGEWSSSSYVDNPNYGYQGGHNGPYHNLVDEYKVSAPHLIFSFERGSVAVAYLKTKLDAETGYPLVPEMPQVQEAIIQYIRFKYVEDMYFSTDNTPKNKYDAAMSNWHYYCRQAKNKLMTITGMDGHASIGHTNQYLMPRDSFFSFFGNLGTKEYRWWNNNNRYYTGKHF